MMFIGASIKQIEAKSRQEEQSYAREHAPVAQPVSVSVADLAELACSEAADATDNDPERRSKHDLCAQYLNAVAADKSAGLASRQFVLSMVGLGAILITLLYTGRQASAAVAANETASRSAETQLRAYVAFDQVNSEQMVDGGNVFLRPVWTNTGTTPTRHLAVGGGHMLSNGPLPEDFDYPDDPSGPGWFSLGGGRQTQVNGGILSPDEVVEIATHHRRLYVWGWAEYSDVFSETKRHRTEFCVQWFLDPNNQPGQIVHGRHNGADDECLKPPHTTRRPDQGESSS